MEVLVQLHVHAHQAYDSYQALEALVTTGARLGGTVVVPIGAQGQL